MLIFFPVCLEEWRESDDITDDPKKVRIFKTFFACQLQAYD